MGAGDDEFGGGGFVCTSRHTSVWPHDRDMVALCTPKTESPSSRPPRTKIWCLIVVCYLSLALYVCALLGCVLMCFKERGEEESP